MVDFESLGGLWSPGAPDPDLIRFVLNSMFRTMHKVLKFLSFFFQSHIDPAHEKYSNSLCFLIGCSKSIDIPCVFDLNISVASI